MIRFLKDLIGSLNDVMDFVEVGFLKDSIVALMISQGSSGLMCFLRELIGFFKGLMSFLMDY